MKLETENWKLRKRQESSGFTLVELMFATAFLAFMLLFIVTAMLQYMAVYNKGLTYKAINQTGRTVFEEVTRSIRVSGADVGNVDEGRLCVGGQAYVWNSPATAAGGEFNTYSGGDRIEGIIRLPDSTGQLCNEESGPLLPGAEDEQTVIASSRVSVQKFIGQSADNGALYHLEMVLGTSGANAPNNTASGITCPPGRDGQYCAVASFETHIARR